MPNGLQKHVLITQFGPTLCVKFFPQNKCFDKHKQQHTPGILLGWRLDHVHTTNRPLQRLFGLFWFPKQTGPNFVPFNLFDQQHNVNVTLSSLLTTTGLKSVITNFIIWVKFLSQIINIQMFYVIIGELDEIWIFWTRSNNCDGFSPTSSATHLKVGMNIKNSFATFHLSSCAQSL